MTFLCLITYYDVKLLIQFLVLIDIQNLNKQF